MPRKLSPTHTLKWPRRNQVQHVMCHVVQRDSSVNKFDRLEITFISALFYQLKLLTDEGGEETKVPGENPSHSAQSNQTYLIQSQCTDTRQTSPSIKPTVPGTWKGSCSHYSATAAATTMTQLGLVPPALKVDAVTARPPKQSLSPNVFVLYCVVLYCTVYCAVLYCIVYCVVLYCTVYCVVLYCTVYCAVLYCTVYCLVLYCIVYCVVLYCIVYCMVFHSVLYGIVLHSVLYGIALYGIALHSELYGIVSHSVLYGIVLYCIVYYMVLYCIVYCMVLYCIVHCMVLHSVLYGIVLHDVLYGIVLHSVLYGIAQCLVWHCIA